MYLFAHKGGSSFTEWFGGDKETFYGTFDLFTPYIFTQIVLNHKMYPKIGVSHSDELQYLYSVNVFQNAIPSDEDELMQHIITKLWVNFAQTG